MNIAAIITEYNPFHNGHKYQIEKVREILGEETAVVAIMSGNYTQRGEIAITDKLVRAKAAVLEGVNLVLELPFPFSMSSAEFFARSGVHIANSLGVITHLVFGSECGNLAQLKKIAKNMMSCEYTEALRTALNDSKSASLGYPTLCERMYRETFDDKIEGGFFEPNNILAIEYIKALYADNSEIIPITIARSGAGYNDGILYGTSLQSASAIREMLTKGDNSAFDFIPNLAKEVFLGAISAGRMPTSVSALDGAVIANLRMNPSPLGEDIHDIGGGLYNRLHAVSMEATNIFSLTTLTETKKFTRARINRAVWNAYFSVTSSVVRALPAYTQVLGMDAVGRSILKRIKKMSDFPVITKPASYKTAGDSVVHQKELSNRADAVFELTVKSSHGGNSPLKLTPFVKK